MSLLNPFFLIGSIALAIPVLIHLVRQEKIGNHSIQFADVPVEGAQAIDPPAENEEPSVDGVAPAYPGAAGRRVRAALSDAERDAGCGGRVRIAGFVMLLDNSYSMRYGNNFDRMKNEATSRIDAMGAGDQMALVAFNDSATVLSVPTVIGQSQAQGRSRVRWNPPSAAPVSTKLSRGRPVARPTGGNRQAAHHDFRLSTSRLESFEP